MTQASRVTFPSRSGAPPFPTVVFWILASSKATPATAASKAFAPSSNAFPAIVLA